MVGLSCCNGRFFSECHSYVLPSFQIIIFHYIWYLIPVNLSTNFLDELNRHFTFDYFQPQKVDQLRLDRTS